MGKKILSEGDAKEYLEDDVSVDLSEFDHINDDAAESLAKYEGSLDLNGLTELSDAAAEFLGKHKDCLYLNGLTELSDAAAESLSKHEGSLYLNGLTELSDKMAAELANRVGSIKLNGLTELSEAAADSLSHVEGVVELNGISELNPAVAKCLAHCRRGLYLNGLTELSVEVAAGLSRSKEGLILEGLTKLNDEVAEHLSQVKGTLSLSNGLNCSLREISDASAEFLSKHEGNLHINSPDKLLSDTAITSLSKKQGTINWSKSSDWAETERQLNKDSTLGKEQAQEYVDCSDPHLTDFKRIDVDAAELLSANLTELYLNGLTELSDEAAGSLSKHEGTLTLNGLTELSDAAAASLSQHVGVLWLNGLTELSDENAAALAKVKGELGLDGVTELSDKAIESLSLHKGNLWLDGVAELSDTTAEAISNHEGELSLNGLTELSDETAKALSEHKNGLGLNGLTELSDAAAASLSKHEGALQLNGLTELSGEVAQVLCEHKYGIGLRGLTELSDEVAKAISGYEGELQLNGLTELSDAAAEHLSRVKWSLDLTGLTELSDAAAASLSKHEGVLYLNGLTELSDEAAKTLSKHEGDLNLDGITILSDPAAASLAKHVGYLDLEGLTEISDTALEALSKKTGTINQGDPKEWAEEFKQNRDNPDEDDDESWDDDENEEPDEDELAGDILTEKIAQKFLGEYASVDLSRYLTIEDEAAESIASQYYDELHLTSLNTLSDPVAESLSKHEGNLYLSPSPIPEMSDQAFESLSGKKTGAINYMSPKKWVCKFNQEGVERDSGSDESEGHILTEKLAQKFLEENDSVDLSDFSIIDDDAAEAIASEYYGELYLTGLNVLSDSVAESLSKHEGDLYLNPLAPPKMSDQAVDMLAGKKEGAITYKSPKKWAEEFKQNRDNSGEEDEESWDDEGSNDGSEEINRSLMQPEELKASLDQIQLALAEIQAELKSNAERLDALDKTASAIASTGPATIQLPIPESKKPSLKTLSPDLQKVLELCCIYLAAVDNLFTDIEQDWVDNHFGEGSSAHFSRVIEIINWDQFFPHLHSLTSNLSLSDKNWIKKNSAELFRELLECDGLDEEEEVQLQQLNKYLSHACSGVRIIA